MISYWTPTIGDAAALAELGQASFLDAFGHLYKPSDLNSFLGQVYSLEAVTDDLNNPDRVFRIAETDGQMVGYCKLGLNNKLDYDTAGVPTMELKQLYLRGAQTGSGIGSALMAWALDEARTRGFAQVILSVYGENHGGQRFYKRHGFEKWGDTIFMVGEQRDEEFIFGRKV